MSELKGQIQSNNNSSIELFKAIIDNNNFCSISYEEIKENARYMLCVNCKKCFNEYPIIQWFVKCNNNNNNNNNITCPTCRILWVDYNIYINNDKQIIINNNK
jgi:hypothetical protein